MAKTIRALTERDLQAAVQLTAGMAATFEEADEAASTLQEVMTALLLRGGVDGIHRAAMEIARARTN